LIIISSLIISIARYGQTSTKKKYEKKYDIEKGLLVKLDSFLQIQLGSVYRGLTRVPDDEVLSLYKNRTIPVKYVEGDKQSVSN
jgi:5' nucleotidase family